MKLRPTSNLHRGFTMIELMIVVAVIAVAVALAAPSFRGLLAKKRIEGVASELATDLQYARSEAVSRNATVRVTFGTGCYLLTAQPDGSSPASTCSQTSGPTLGAGAVNIKHVQLQSGATASLSPNASLTYIEFDPVRGIASFSTGSGSGSVNINSSIGSWQLRANVTAVGSMSLCTPGGTVTGYVSC